VNAANPSAEVENFTQNNYLTASLDYNDGEAWGVTTSLPYIMRTHSTFGSGDGSPDGAANASNPSGNGYLSQASGFGDMKIIGRYFGFSEEKDWGFQFGVKLPTGSNSQVTTNNAGKTQAVDPGLQLGTGSTDLIGGIYKFGFILEMLGLKIVNSLIWYKRNAFPNVTQRMFCESTEQMIWAVNNSTKKAKNWTFNYNDLKLLTENGKQMRNMWDIPMTPPSEKEFGKHPSQKPLQVMDRLIIGCTNEGDLVLDPFCGSGSTALSAKNNKRHFYTIDSDASYIELAKKRILNPKVQKSLL